MSDTKHRPGSLLGSLLGLIGFSAIAGLLVSATLTPALAVATTTANSGLDLFESLPSYAQIDQQPERNRIYGLRDGQPVEIAQFFDQNREVVAWEDISRYAVDALVAGEDRRFYQHGGVDPPSIIRAGLSELGVGRDSGASTLTMQLVRQQIGIHACLQDDEESQAICDAQYSESYARKLAEMRLAIGLEQRYTKDEIILAYLNTVNFGGNVYGIEAAAQRIFNTSASSLTIEQAAALIATVQNPSTRNLLPGEHQADNFERNQQRRDFIINQMANEGYITAEQAEQALAVPVDEDFVDPQPQRNGCISGYDSTRFFCDYVERVLQREEGGQYILGATEEDNAAVLALGGLRIYTSIDVGLNDEVQAVLDEYVPNTETRWQSGGAVIQLEVSTGRILSMAQNKDFDKTENAPPTATGVNFTTDYEYGGSRGFQPGSGAKIFTLAQWFEDGHGANEVLDTRKIERTLTACGAPTESYNPQNNEGVQRNRASVVDIFVNSLNTGAMEMASEMDLCDIRDTAQRMGVSPAPPPSEDNPDDELHAYPSFVIGSSDEVSPMSMAEAFQTVANGGVHCEPRAIDRIVARDGSEIAPPAQSCEAAFDPEVAAAMQFVLQTVTERNPLNNPAGPIPVISKTGTSNNVVQTWVNGASPAVATSVWVGNIVGGQNLNDLGRWHVRSTVFSSVMESAMTRYDEPGSRFLTPNAETLRGDSVELPNVAGLTEAAAVALLEGDGFDVTVGDPVEGQQDVGLIEFSSPGAGSLVTPSTPVTIFPSSGPPQETEEPEETTAPTEAAGPTWPNLVNQTYAEAQGSVQDAGFDPANIQVTWEDHGQEAQCLVLAQNPEAGTSGQAGDPISIVVGSNAGGQNPGC